MISILIVESNEPPFAPGRREPSLASIQHQAVPPCEVIVVENPPAGFAAPGGTPADLETLHPSVSSAQSIKVIRAEHQLTPAAARNLAAHHATGEFLLLLAEDAVLLTGIGDALAVLEGDPAIGAVGAEMFHPDGRFLVSCAHFPTPRRLWSFASMWHIPVENWKTIGGVPVRRCDYVDGSFLLTRASVWRSIGGMDPQNLLYGDEMDLCQSLLDAGFVTVHCPSVRYLHAGGYSPSRMAHLYGGFRRYHRRFSSRFTRIHAELVLRAGLVLRLPLYWWKSRRGDGDARLALQTALHLHRHWNQTAPDASGRHPNVP